MLHVHYLHINPKLKDLISCIIFTTSRESTSNEKAICLHPATPQTGLCFHLDDGISLRRKEDNKFVKQPTSIIVGQQVSPVSIKVGKKFRSVRVGFQPGGLQLLLGISLSEITDKSLNAEDVWGNEIKNLNYQLQETSSVTGVNQLINNFFLKKYQFTRINNAFDYAIKHLINSGGNISVSHSSALANLSTRQFERLCIERTGVTAKTLARIARFSKAYRLKEKHVEMSWTNIAHECHYYDQSHLIKDFNSFAGYSPKVIEKHLLQSPVKLQSHLKF